MGSAGRITDRRWPQSNRPGGLLLIFSLAKLFIGPSDQGNYRQLPFLPNAIRVFLADYSEYLTLSETGLLLSAVDSRETYAGVPTG